MARGWEVLHKAALLSGGEAQQPASEPGWGVHIYIDIWIYHDLLSPLLEVLEVGDDVVEFCGRPPLVMAAVRRQLRRVARRQAPKLFKHLIGLDSRTSVLAEFASTPLAIPAGNAPTYAPSDPVSVVRYGHWLICERSRQVDIPIIPICWGLALIGVVWGEQLKCGYCKLCFRRSRPGGLFCDYHSQSIRQGEARSAAYMRYRQGCRAHALANQRGYEFLDALHRMHAYTKAEFVLAKLLFEPGTPSRRALIGVLSRTPAVVQRLGLVNASTMPIDEIIVKLRTGLDPHEWDDHAWLTTVWLAEMWFALEEEVSPGQRGKGKITTTRVREAIALASQGIRNGEIAKRLGVSPAAVSQWAIRYDEFKKACQVRDCKTAL